MFVYAASFECEVIYGEFKDCLCWDCMRWVVAVST